ncbi:hypothetical protein BC828DRAFT_380424 [Blastocladiella britannica]|nr:hypothetical protein BC828DRAFT_380424 [Blastocladiella britannica]
MAATADCAIVSKFSFTATAAIPAVAGNAADCCSWPVVTCGGGRVISLMLDSGKVQNAIPADIGKLSGLVELIALNSGLTGEVPDLSGLTSLEAINLSNNRLTGYFPSGLTKLPKLRELLIYSNQLTGTLPTDFDQLRGTLMILNVGDNKLSGPLPSSIGSLSKLTSLHADANAFTGPIPTTFNQLTQVQDMWLFQNKLTELPDLTRLTNLQSLMVYGNPLTGRVPNLPSPSGNCTIMSSSSGTADATKFECYAGTTTTGLCYKSISTLPVCTTPAQPVKPNPTPGPDPETSSFTVTDIIILIVCIGVLMFAGYGVSVFIRRRKFGRQQQEKEVVPVVVASSSPPPPPMGPTVAAGAVGHPPPPAYVTHASAGAGVVSGFPKPEAESMSRYLPTPAATGVYYAAGPSSSGSMVLPHHPTTMAAAPATIADQDVDLADDELLLPGQR